MFTAKEVDFNTLKESPLRNETSADGRGFAVANGVAGAVVNAIKLLEPNLSILIGNLNPLLIEVSSLGSNIIASCNIKSPRIYYLFLCYWYMIVIVKIIFYFLIYILIRGD